MVTKKDILEIKRLASPENCSYTRLRGCYVSVDEIKITINETFLNLPEEVFYKYLDIASGIFMPKSLNDRNKVLEIEDEDCRDLLTALTESGLKDDAAVETFYNCTISNYLYPGNYLILLYHDCYDVMKRAGDNQELDESEEVYDYIICAICPVQLEKESLECMDEQIKSLDRKWLVGKPVEGFVYPAFEDRSANRDKVLYYCRKPGDPSHGIMENVLGCKAAYTATEYREEFEAMMEAAVNSREMVQQYLQGINAVLETVIEGDEGVHRLEPDEMAEIMRQYMPKEYVLPVIKQYRKMFEPAGYPDARWMYDQKLRDQYYAREHKDRCKKLLNAAANALSHAGTMDLAKEIEDFASKIR